jgi:hypothetical protein
MTVVPSTFNVSRLMARGRLLRVYLLVLLSASITPASSDAPGPDGARSTLAATVLVLDEGTRALGDSAADPRTILRGIAQRLVASASPVSASINRFLNRVPARASTDFICGEDFVRTRARQELARIRETLLNSKATPLEPQFCYATPYAVDASHPPNVVEFYGFDFDAAPIEMFLVSDSGYKDVSPALIRHNHYHITLQIGGADGVRLTTKSLTLGLTWGNLIAHAIPVVQANTRLCPSAVEEIPAGKSISVDPPPLPGDAPPTSLTTPALIGHGTLDYQRNAVIATICLVARAPRADSTVYSGCANEYVASLDPDRTIERILGPLEARLSASPSGRAADSVVGGASGFVRRWVVRRSSSDSRGSGPHNVTIILGRVRVVLTAPDRCISAIAFGEARRTGALGATAAGSLGNQLAATDARIVGLRPRFAPQRVPRAALTK